LDPLVEKLKEKQPVILYGLTPPRSSFSHEKINTISQRRISRLEKVEIDGLIIYDIQNEVTRNSDSRPFPFLDTVDSILYRDLYMKDLELSSIVYQCVGKYSPREISERMKKIGNSCAVFVGASSKNEFVKCSLSQAYERLEEYPHLNWGGVTIPERHITKGDEHRRILSKQARGAEFFISQFIFNVEKLKNLLSDYYYTCKNEIIPMVPMIFTITPCGSQKTLDLLKWLGVDIPSWIQNELIHSHNILEQSMDLCLSTVKELCQFCISRKIPFGCNIESVSVGRDEVLASFELVTRVNDLFKNMHIRS
jgi:hypothetical protein